MKIMEKTFISPIKQPIFILQSSSSSSSSPPPPPLSPASVGLKFNKLSPSILIIIIIFAIIFFISGILHLLVRFLLRPSPRRDHDHEIDDVTVLQGQLQQLFHLHDSGVDQSYIDTLPVFNYKEIIGLKSPFDCAVCLSELEPEDKLRLLPKCSHAFHMDCIDTWLLSHSTCPLCRASLLNDFSTHHNLSHVVLVLESGSESSREISSEYGTNISSSRTNSHIRAHLDTESRVPLSDLFQKSGEINVKEEKNQEFLVGSGEKVVKVKLGKFRNVNGGGRGECSSEKDIVDERRCFSMGSFAYVMDENLSLQVPIRTPIKKTSCKKLCHRAAMSECGWDSTREIFGFEAFGSIENQENGKKYETGADEKGSCSSKKESFSISKIWLREKEDIKQTSRRSFSFRLPF